MKSKLSQSIGKHPIAKGAGRSKEEDALYYANSFPSRGLPSVFLFLDVGVKAKSLLSSSGHVFFLFFSIFFEYFYRSLFFFFLFGFLVCLCCFLNSLVH